MMSEKFTPGPWWTDAVYNEEDLGCSIIAANTDCGPMPGNPTRGQVAFATEILPEDAETAKANAHLIAAAPDLYAALESLRGNVIGWGDDSQIEAISDDLRAASAALARARGGSND
jgi:hypothetical protein